MCSGGRPQKWVWGYFDDLWHLLRHDICLSCQHRWARFASSEGMNTFRTAWEWPKDSPGCREAVSHLVVKELYMIKKALSHLAGSASYQLHSWSGSNPSLLLNRLVWLCHPYIHVHALCTGLFSCRSELSPSHILLSSSPSAGMQTSAKHSHAFANGQSFESLTLNISASHRQWI